MGRNPTTTHVQLIIREKNSLKKNNTIRGAKKGGRGERKMKEEKKLVGV